MRKLIEDAALSEGESSRIDCPKCGGRNTFTMTKQNGIVLYNCYKLGCGCRGAAPVGISREDVVAYMNSKKPLQQPENEPMEVPLSFVYNLTDPAVQRFINKWKLHDVFLIHDKIDNRVVFPITDETMRMVDAIGRTLDGSVPKWLRYTGNGEYYTFGKSHNTVAVVIEDCISAVTVHKCCKNATGVAILGTTLTDKQIQHLTKYDRVVIALDPDAVSKTIEFTQQLRLYVDDVKALYLSDDIKYREPQDVYNLMEMVNE